MYDEVVLAIEKPAREFNVDGEVFQRELFDRGARTCLELRVHRRPARKGFHV